jgi:hypothetical protein
MIVFALAFASFIERYNRCAMCESEARHAVLTKI